MKYVDFGITTRLCLALAVVSQMSVTKEASAQGTRLERYMVTPAPGIRMPHNVLIAQVGSTTQIILDINEPAVGGNMVVIQLDPQMAIDFAATHPQLRLEQDVLLVSDAATPDKVAYSPVPKYSGTSWALQSIYGTGPTCSFSHGWTPEIYVIDTGVQKFLPTGQGNVLLPEWTPDTGPARLEFGPGKVSPSVQATAPLVPADTLAYRDPNNHGTSVAAAAVGKTTGVLMQWPNLRAKLYSYRLYATGVATAYISEAVALIYAAGTQHLQAWSDQTMGNEGGVLVFANRTTTDYSLNLEKALWDVTKNSFLCCVCSAGNEESPIWPDSPETVPISGAPTPVSGGWPTSPSRLAPSYFEFSQENNWVWPYLLLVGASAVGDVRAPTSNYGPDTDLFAPGQQVPLVINTGAQALRDGSSFASGFAAGMCLAQAALTPWATPQTLRNRVLNGSAIIPIGLTIPNARSLRQTPCPATIVRNYADWAADCGLNSASLALKATDADGDYYSNVLEYYLGFHPRMKNSVAIPWFTKRGGSTYVQFPRSMIYNFGVPDVIGKLEYSPTLTGWNGAPAVLTAPTPNVMVEGQIQEQQTYPADQRNFYRVTAQ